MQFKKIVTMGLICGVMMASQASFASGHNHGCGHKCKVVHHKQMHKKIAKKMYKKHHGSHR
ncbi:MAG: hypothetical protein P1U74_04830 [Legionellaceae bacterium]|nr:hypothetical protein [Legionellaceae bacterium]